MSFLRNFLAVIAGLVIFSLFSFFVFIGIVASLENDEIPTVKENSVLYLKMSGLLTERTQEDPLQELLPQSGPAFTGLLDLLDAIKAAKSDDNIRGIYMEHQYLAAGFASLQEVRNALLDFKESGKFIYSYGAYVSEGDYFLASVADTIMLHPEGSLEFNGLAVTMTFWKGMFDKLGIEPEIFRVGQYKSYVEPFQQKSMSAENRTQYKELLTSVYTHYLKEVAKSRDTDAQKLRNISDQLLVQLPSDAVSYGLVTRLAYEDEAKALIRTRIGLEADQEISFISHKSYSKTVTNEFSKNKVAVIVASGEIVMGGGENVISGEQFAREIRKARENEQIKAIVLRVNSPGGSLTASDMIWREIQLTKGVKPVIASMSDVAASGGYYISMFCDTIVAQPTTITGSIGIFGMMFNLDPFLEGKLGITHDVVRTGEYSDIMTVTRSLSPYERSVIQKSVEKGYQSFITKAAEGRGMTPEEINERGGGRVWTGIQAQENGLVDVLGSYKDAVQLAATAAGIQDDYRIVQYPFQQPFFERVFGRLGDEADARILSSTPYFFSAYKQEIESLLRMKGIQARMASDIHFE